MRYITLIIFFTSLIYSCNDKSNNSNNNESLIPVSDKEIEELNKQIISDSVTLLTDSIKQLSEVFKKAVRVFPNDSATLYRFYFEWHPAKNQEILNNQIKRLKSLTSDESVTRYNEVEKNLKPLLTKIVSSSALSKSQADDLVRLYSDYDYFSGEALFSKLFKGNEDYSLIWNSFGILAKESKKDTCYISALIKLDRNIRTNVELAESMPDFIVKAIHNNPLGFLSMYGKRQENQRTDFANYITIFGDLDKELFDIYTGIARNSKNEDFKKLADELIGKFKP
jgi:hypothetical protein